MTEEERVEKEAGLALLLRELVQAREPEPDSRAVAHLLMEYLDEIDRKLEDALVELARLKGWDG